MIFNMGAMNLQKAGKSMTIQLLFSYWHQNNCSQKKKKKIQMEITETWYPMI